MSIPLWPVDLPQRVVADSYSEALPDGRLRTAMETGPPKTRRRFSSAVRPVSASFRLSPDGKARLERFWREETADGTLPFLLQDQTHDAAPLVAAPDVPLLDDQGQPLVIAAWWLVIFGENAPVFQTRNRGLSYVAAFTLSVLP